MYNWKDRLIDWANQRGAWTHILVAAGIALIITAIILAAAMPSKGAVDANAGDIGEAQNTIGMVVSVLGKKASQEDLDAWGVNFSDALDDWIMGISGFGTRINNAETRLNAIENDVAELVCSPPAGYLAGIFPNYTFHVRSSEAGNFTANVHLFYQPAIGGAANYTVALEDFYAGIDFTESVSAYIPIVTSNGVAWGIVEVWFNIGTFPLGASVPASLNITCAGLNSTWEPDFAYVEVWPI